jgi:ubiquinone/menaquinone biosynthesis C-methylase UbiE
MKLNYIEKALMNNPVRSNIQRLYEAKLLEKLGGKTIGLNVLEVGCGRGVGTEIIFKRFGASRVSSIDLDPIMVKKAKARLSNYSLSSLDLQVGDVSNLQFNPCTFDAVFDFGIIHHVLNWKDAIREIVRVLKPGGRFYFEEVTKQALDRWLYRTFLDHPKADRFTSAEFIRELEKIGLTIGDNFVTKFFGDFVIGVAIKNKTAADSSTPLV